MNAKVLRALVYVMWFGLIVTLAGSFGCVAMPDVVRLEAQHTSHNWGAPGYDYGYDSFGVTERWQEGGLIFETTQIQRLAKDGPHQYVGAKVAYDFHVPK